MTREFGNQAYHPDDDPSQLPPAGFQREHMGDLDWLEIRNDLRRSTHALSRLFAAVGISVNSGEDILPERYRRPNQS